MKHPEGRIQEYITRYPAPAAGVTQHYEGVPDKSIVIPLMDESQNIRWLVRSLSEQPREELLSAAIVFVVNNGPDVSDEIRDSNKRTLEFLDTVIKGKTEFRLPNMTILDCSTPGNELPLKNAGVGLARKTGLDFALQTGAAAGGNHVLICLDGDCVVSGNYLHEISKAFACGVQTAVIQYEHRIEGFDEPLQRAIVCYELFLRYYHLGLYYAGSPYAFHTIGSSMAFTADTYLKCQGMSKLKAGEDFYFLQKAAKFSDVYTINTTRVYPSPRSSYRVPFGTGRRVQRFLSGGYDEYLLHDPHSFLVLKQWLSVFNAAGDMSAADLLKAAGEISPALQQFLIVQKFDVEWDAILAKSGNLNAQRKIWFDGFRTLKWIHFSRDNGSPDITMFAAIHALYGMAGFDTGSQPDENIPRLQEQMEILSKMRQISTIISTR